MNIDSTAMVIGFWEASTSGGFDSSDPENRGAPGKKWGFSAIADGRHQAMCGLTRVQEGHAARIIVAACATVLCQVWLFRSCAQAAP